MVTRCGYTVEQNQIIERRVQINWDLGFDKEAKRAYIQRIINALPDDYKPAVDVTTASPIYEARSLSPFYVTRDGVNIEDTWAKTKEELPGLLPGAFDYIYLSSLSEEQIDYVLRQKTFIDVFHNPEKAISTQARSLCALQILHNTNNMHLLNDFSAFVDWFAKTCSKVNMVLG